MTTATPIPKGPDPIALAAAKAAQQAVSPDTVILFGSRARGDHRPNSDLDLLIVCGDDVVGPTSRAGKAVRTYFELNPPRLDADVIPIGKAKFDYCRRAKNHVAAQAMRDGIIMSGERLDYNHSYDDGYPDSWPDVKERLQAAYRHLGTFQREITHPDGYQEMYGFHAQQAIENSIKAWLSAADLDYRRVHYRYAGASFRMDDLERSRFQREITLAARTFINRAYELTGTGESDVWAGQ